ncbi:hypothetical protein Plim_0031 [Planctopirus limnophila DSM 3776]|uniref:Uncharacterized protein n=1 Tax=Planctopirus limnophila (strain ATCC 43296 / DSM 3776 / IFAM 1008 / Mu 290) TaxID=521674 RepID=D5SMG4_PLAL2|nr:hypothetical protein Plim_0031 [Planctopirus limnophila DSM 3776]
MFTEMQGACRWERIAPTSDHGRCPETVVEINGRGEQQPEPGFLDAPL